MAAPDRAKLRQNRCCGACASRLGQKVQRQTRPAGEPNRYPAQEDLMILVRNCAKAIIIRDGKILAVKYADEGGEYYALPGGGQLHGETLPQALLRECREELGISVRNCGLKFIREYIGKFGESSWRDADVHQVEFIYECEIVGEDDPRGGTHRNHTQVDIAWLLIDAITNYRFYPKKLIGYLDEPLPSEIEYWGNAE